MDVDSSYQILLAVSSVLIFALTLFITGLVFKFMNDEIKRADEKAKALERLLVTMCKCQKAVDDMSKNS